MQFNYLWCSCILYIMNTINKPVTMAVIGAGARGTYSYAPYSLEEPGELKITAIAEPNNFRRKQFAEMYNIEKKNQFTTWEDLLENHTADSVLIANQDRDHFSPILKAMEKGFHILAEKPITVDLDEAIELLKKTSEYEKVFLICHVLRYTPFFQKLKSLLTDGIIGDLKTVQHNEYVGHFHQAHSFVRGHWRKTCTSSPMILAKSCHDMDILNWIIDDECTHISSFGSLGHFHLANAPAGSTEKCTQGCSIAESCPYSALRYLGNDADHHIPEFAKIVTDHWDGGDLREALEKGPYGQCVYRCDNDVVDHQVVNIEYANGCTVAFTMTAFSDKTCRAIRLMGTDGEIRGHMEKNEVEVTTFYNSESTTYNIEAPEAGHGGGDTGIIKSFIEQIRQPDLDDIRKRNRQSIIGHLMALDAEYSRVSKKIKKLDY